MCGIEKYNPPGTCDTDRYDAVDCNLIDAGTVLCVKTIGSNHDIKLEH